MRFYQEGYVHPTAGGHRRIAEETFSFLRDNGLFCQATHSSR